jgi:hypothetical protein
VKIRGSCCLNIAYPDLEKMRKNIVSRALIHLKGQMRQRMLDAGPAGARCQQYDPTARGEEQAKTAQLTIEYDPQPPFDSGSVEKASLALVNKVKASLLEYSRKAASVK